MRRLAKRKGALNNPFGDQYIAKFKLVAIAPVQTSFAGGEGAIQVLSWILEGLNSLLTAIGDTAGSTGAPGMRECQLVFEEYRMLSTTVKTVFFPEQENLEPAAALQINKMYFGSSANPSQIPTTFNYPELKEHPNVRLTPLMGQGLYDKPSVNLHKFKTKKLLPDFGTYITTNFVGQTTTNSTQPLFTDPTGPLNIVQTWVTTLDPSGMPSGQVHLGDMLHEIYVTVKFWGRRNITF